jgi:aspartyl-tRNA(Asn)/glutamyl-tRNA(Gln) amidotransferase subunit C
MSVTKSEIKRVLDLSKLNASDNDLIVFKKDLDKVLELLNNISDIVIETEIMVSPVENYSIPLRKDVSSPMNYQSYFQNLAPRFEQEHFIVPKVVD